MRRSRRRNKVLRSVYLTVLFVAPLISSISYSDTVYKCDNEGRVTYSQTPCSEEFSVIEIEPGSEKSRAEESSRATDLEKLSAESSLRTAKNQMENLKRRIDYLEGSASGLEKKRDEKLAKLKKELKRTFAMKRQNEIVAEMERVKERYRKDKIALSDKIHRYKMDLIDRERSYRIHASKYKEYSSRSNAAWCPCDGTYNCYDERNMRYCVNQSGLKVYRDLK